MFAENENLGQSKDHRFFAELGCPHSQVALVNNDHPVVCTASGASCPTGYFCQFSDRNKQFQCCGHKAGCPGDSVAYLDLTGGAQECSVKLRNCPEGYSCQNSKGGKTICCTARIGGRDRPMIGEGSSNITIAPGAPETPGATVPPPTMSPSVTSGGNPGKSLCPPDTALINGECKVRGAVGSVCLLSSQCTSGAECVGQMCACGKKFREQDGRCIQVDTDEVVKEVVVAKEVIRPVLAGCKENQVEKNSACLDKSAIGAACTADEQCPNGTVCTLMMCKCAHGSSPYKDRCLNNINICEAPRQPVISSDYTLIQCAKQKCPKPSACVYSKMIQSYVCCSSAPVTLSKPIAPPVVGRIVKGGRIVGAPATTGAVIVKPHLAKYTCPDGRVPMLFPQNNMPLVCNPVKGCPQGHTCINKMCCPNGRVKRSESCPRGYLMVERGGEAQCEPQCPWYAPCAAQRRR
eukprot:NP_741075.1 Uncharacterized protein CELE_T22F7.5 [Caenorhabditis elegans]